MVEQWSEGVHYVGAVVTHGGSLYQAQRDTGRAPGEHPDWICLARGGRDGVDGRSFNVCGTFDPQTSYRVLDVVTLNSTWFVSIRDNPGPCPGDGWKAGPNAPRGKPGERGERGATGPRGEKGDPAREVLHWEIDRSTYSIVPILTDGSKGPPLEVRELFEQFQIETH
jgi:hypothetical protein